MQLYYRRMVRISLVLIYLVILAGAVVRMTGSGMGCPDWPKCFGYLVPPTERTQLLWHPNRHYKKGQVIIRDEALWVANNDFMTGPDYLPEHWSPYTRHRYAVFNATHTWTEFINRLLGALAGVATLIMAGLSFTYRKVKSSVPIISWLVVFAMGFQAWLGATVVFSVLEAAKVTVHMVMALIIVGMLLYLLHDTSMKDREGSYDRKTAMFWYGALLLTLVQIILGTQVRQFVDSRTGQFGEGAKNMWLSSPPSFFYVHRSFSVVVVLWNVYLASRIARLNLRFAPIKWVLGLLFLEVATGISMNYMYFPFGTQPVHLLLASLVFGIQSYVVLTVIKISRNLKTS